MNNIQYTIRNIPAPVDQVIRKRAAQSGKSFNQTVVDLLSLQTFGTTEPPAQADFDWLFAQNTLDKNFDATLAELSKIDQKLWQSKQ